AGTRMPEFTLEELKEHGGVYKCCKAYGIPLVESSKISMEMAVKEGWYTKNGSKWKTMPEQMLRYRAASFFGRVYAPELLMGLRSVEEEQDRIIDVTPDQSLSEQADTNKLKREILSAKSPAALDEAESKALMLTDDAKREELLKMISAQAKKFQPAAAVVNDQNSTSNDVAEKTVSAKKPEPEKEEAPPVETVQVKKPTSAEVKKDYLVKMNQAESVVELNQLREQFVINKALTDVHLNYLESAYTQYKAKFNKPAEEEVKEAPAVNEIKSAQIIGGLKIQIGNAQNITELEAVAKTIRDNKPNITPDHMNDVLNVYAARKQFLENQLSMFDTDETPWADKAIAEIEAAKNQDEINNIFIDPMYEEQSDPDQQRITNAAQKRESELFGN
ncbi:MAG: recombinase RecT, partial [Acinetobacter sp.]